MHQLFRYRMAIKAYNCAVTFLGYVGAQVVDMSTSDPALAREIYAVAQER
jgi:3-hydroxyisobutyrate dehydrogenase-like beta-hydroxyacid dehydrogenase